MEPTQNNLIRNIHSQMLRAGLYTGGNQPFQQLTALLGMLGLDDCVVFRYREAWLTQVAAHGPKYCHQSGVLNPITLPISQGVVGYTARTRSITVINEASFDSRYVVDDNLRESELAMPLIREGELVGVVDSEHAQPYFFTQQHIDLFLGALEVIGFDAPNQGEPVTNKMDQRQHENTAVQADHVTPLKAALLAGLKGFTDSSQLSALLIQQPTLRQFFHSIEQFRTVLINTAKSYAEQTKTIKYHAILKHTYFDPLSSGCLIAERLHMGYSTYRRHLAKARQMLITDVIERMTNSAIVVAAEEPVTIVRSQTEHKVSIL